jgi:hypothetical protein
MDPADTTITDVTPAQALSLTLSGILVFGARQASGALRVH